MPHTFEERLTVCIQRLAESGVAALGGLFDLTSQRLVLYATAITRNQHDAEDAVQAALVQVARNLSRFCEVDQPWPYLLRMVRNEALLIARRKQRWTLSSCLTDLRTVRRVDELEQEETHRAVWSALRSLPVPQAEVVGAEDLGRDDACADRGDPRGLAGYRSQPLPLRDQEAQPKTLSFARRGIA